jgi:hypothetical protein
MITLNVNELSNQKTKIGWQNGFNEKKQKQKLVIIQL